MNEAAVALIRDAKDLSESSKSRLVGTINAMKNPRAKDVLIRLRDRKLISDNLIGAFDRLRNKLAHGGSLDSIDRQRDFNDCEALLVLFYQLIFLRIGYVGSYTDYSVFGWPLNKFEANL